TSTPVVRRTRATLRNAEFGFFGVMVYMRVQTPRRCGESLRAGALVFVFGTSRPERTSCWIVGMALSSALCRCQTPGPGRSAGPAGQKPLERSETAYPPSDPSPEPESNAPTDPPSQGAIDKPTGHARGVSTGPDPRRSVRVRDHLERTPSDGRH